MIWMLLLCVIDPPQGAFSDVNPSQRQWDIALWMLSRI
ncbi:hypothetical protein PAMC26510_25790 [Caballeronia sordidicola]|uniref:Uncharacterized protein n=1 Tax=Caballeronia sordidicola TaxID=196367 RepID=A0A242MG82_CABSO|nr:hypothetical protein PAMC26510_25790 [Caballeronia sordidicola]